MRLETDRLILREPVAADADAAVAFWTSDRAQYVGGPMDPRQAWRHFASLVGHWTLLGFGLWTVTTRDDDAALGMVGPYKPGGWPEAEVGWVLFDDAEGRGIAEEAARAVLADVRTRLGWTTVVHYIARGNARSVALATRLGAVEDPGAATPGGKSCHVYRQPEAA